MIMIFPIKFDRTVQITYHDGSIESSSVFPAKKGLLQCTFQKINGYDANHKRVTNLVGYNGRELLKKCPNCHRIKPVTEYGYTGRITNIRRDQSQCSECRSVY